MNDSPPRDFTCKTCGGHTMTATLAWHVLAGPDSESWQEWGLLEADHFWRFKFKGKVEKEHDAGGEVERGKFGEYARDGSSSAPDDCEIHESRDNPGNDGFYVNCAGCDRGIEFGWAQPSRGGGMFPVECSDFVLGNIWPEPGYWESCQRKGWLPSGDVQR